MSIDKSEFKLQVFKDIGLEVERTETSRKNLMQQYIGKVESAKLFQKYLENYKTTTFNAEYCGEHSLSIDDVAHIKSGINVSVDKLKKDIYEYECKYIEIKGQISSLTAVIDMLDKRSIQEVQKEEARARKLEENKDITIDEDNKLESKNKTRPTRKAGNPRFMDQKEVKKNKVKPKGKKK